MQETGERHDFQTHKAQISSIFRAWGMPEEGARQTGEVLGWADLHGVESHGIAMIVEYDERRSTRPVNMAPEPKIVSEKPGGALVDGDGGFGHVPATFAMRTAIRKAKDAGIAAVSVRNSGHFGALGYFTGMAAEAGLIGLATTTVFGVRVAPTGGRRPRFGSDPISFAAPGADGVPFLLDMATCTVASGKVRNKVVEKQPIPPGWGMSGDGQPTTDPAEVMNGGFLAPLGGTPEGASHKGYGLAAMVNILSACLSGSTLITDPMHSRQPWGLDVGHFFLALDPGMFRVPDDFMSDVTRFCNDLRSTDPLDPETPVMVAGDPERKVRDERLTKGIPLGPGMRRKLHEIAQRDGAEWLLGVPESVG